MGKISPDTASNRLGRPTVDRPKNPIIWVHAASLGELSSIRPFLSYLVKTRPDHRLLITTNNPKALDVAARWPEISAILQASPMDLPYVLNRFLDHWMPVAFVNVESEIWPNRFAALARRNIPCIGLNARVSDTSAKRLARFGLASGLRHFKAIFAQNETSATNYKRLLGSNATVEVIPNFKSMVSLPAPDPKLQNTFDRGKTILAASTHPGEDEIILDAFAKLYAQDPSLTLIIAPRHVDRAADVAVLVTTAGLTSQTIGQGTTAPVHIVTTLGQLPALYSLASVTCVGGSLVPNIGGHTPYEPIRADSAIVTGRHTQNFETEYQTLNAATACLITTPEELANNLANALKSAPSLATAAKTALPPIPNPDALMTRIALTLELAK